MKLLFIVAPTVDEEIHDQLKKGLAEFSQQHPGLLYEVRQIVANESFETSIRQCLQVPADLLVAVGGDGTVATVAHIAIEHKLPIGIIPAGTGNLVARELGLPLELPAALSVVVQQEATRLIDVMTINHYTYLLNAGVGINAEVIDRTSRLGKTLFGRSAYVGTAIWKTLQARAQNLEITIDDQKQTYQATDVLISNCGGLARILHPNGPDIRVDDGQVDISVICMKVAIEYPWFYFLRRLFPQHVNRVIFEHPVRHSVTINSNSPLAVQADGDIIGTTPVEIKVHPKALRVIVPVKP